MSRVLQPTPQLPPSADHGGGRAGARRLLPPGLLVLALAVAAVAVTSSTWADIFTWASEDQESGQILLAPLVVAWILWARRDRLAGCPRSPDWPGPVLVAAGLLCWWFGFYHEHDLFWHGGAVLLLSGAVVSVLGSRFLRAALPAFAALAFLVPVSGMGRQYFSAPLQAVTSRATQVACETLGMVVERQGNVLVAGGKEVAIAEACNGLRMVFPLLLAVYLFAFVTKLPGWVRPVILLASPLVAVVCNVLRLVPTVWVYGHYDEKAAAEFHDIGGWVMLPVAFLMLLGVGKVLRWALEPQDNPPAEPAGGRPTVRGASHLPLPVGSRGAPVAAALLLALGGVVRWYMPAATDATAYHARVAAAAAAVPAAVGDWVAADAPLPAEAVGAIRPNVILSRQYTSRQTGRKVGLLFVQVRDARRLVDHYPPVCYAARGWGLLGSRAQDWPLADPGADPGPGESAANRSIATGTEYEFEHGVPGRMSVTAVEDFMVLPDGRIARDMEAVRAEARRLNTRFYGAAQLQLLFDGAVPRDERSRVTAELAGAYLPLIRAVRSGRPAGPG